MAPVDVQIYQFSVMVLAGMVLGATYDLYRTFRLMTAPGRWATVVYDAFFWFIATALVLAAVFYASWGEVRAYVFLGTATGAFLYFKLASPLVLRALRTIWVAVARLLRFLARVFHVLVVIPLRLALAVVARILVTITTPCVMLARLAAYGVATVKKKLARPPETPPTA